MREFPITLSGSGELVLSTGAGRVEVVAVDRADVLVTVAPVTAGDESAARLVGRAAVQAVVLPAGSVEVWVPRGAGSAGGAVLVRALVPVGSAVQVHTTGATVCARGELGHLFAVTAGGSVDVDRAVGVAVRTSGGAVRVGRVAEVDVQTVSGAVRIDQVTAWATVSTVDGAVAVHGAGSRWAGRQIRVDAASTNGDVIVTADDGVTVHTDCQSATGRVQVPGGAR